VRVLLVNHRFWPVEGGTERWTLGLARALIREGIDVQVLTQAEPGVPPVETREGIRIRRLAITRMGPWRFPRSYWRTLRSLDYDLLHVSGNRVWCADYYFPVAKIVDGPQVVTPHDFYQLAMSPSWYNHLYFRRYLPRALRAFDAYLAVNPREAERVVMYGLPSERVHFVGEGVDASDFPTTRGSRERTGELRKRWSLKNPVMLLYVGGFWENKRLDRLVRAAAMSRHRVALVLVGRDQPETHWNRTRIEILAQQMGVEVHCPGLLPREDLIEAYYESDLYVQASQYEAFGISVVESCLAGRPFLSYEVGIAPVLADAGAGVVVRNDQQFASELRRLAENPALREVLGRQARRAGEEWSWERVLPRYLRIYRSVLASH